jgi:hypothetical protein
MSRVKLAGDANGIGVLGLIVSLLVIGVIAVIFGVVRMSPGKGIHLSNGCKDTNIAVSPVDVKSLDTPATFTARLTMGTQPVNNERVTFRLIAHDQKNRPAGSILGYATTNASGIATLQNRTVSSYILPEDTPTGYEAIFDGNGIHDNHQTTPFYCGSNATANILIQK